MHSQQIKPGSDYWLPLLLFMILLSTLTLNIEPLYNWDLLGYVATAISYDNKDVNMIHKLTYEEVYKHTPELKFNDLIRPEYPFSFGVFKNAEQFFQQIPFYKVKPAYPCLMLLLSKLNISLVEASILISKLSFWVLGLVLFNWLSSIVNPWLSLFMSLLMMSSAFMVIPAGLSSPDMLYTLTGFTAFYLISKDKIYGALVVIVLSILIRPDSILVVLLISMYFLITRSAYRKAALVAAVIGITLSLASQRLTEQ